MMADGQEQEYIITSAPSTSTEAANLEDVLSYATVTTDQGHEVLPQVTRQFLLWLDEFGSVVSSW